MWWPTLVFICVAVFAVGWIAGVTYADVKWRDFTRKRFGIHWKKPDR